MDRNCLECTFYWSGMTYQFNGMQIRSVEGGCRKKHFEYRVDINSEDSEQKIRSAKIQTLHHAKECSDYERNPNYPTGQTTSNNGNMEAKPE